MSIRTGVVEGEEERVKSAEIGVGEVVVGLDGGVQIASPPSVPPLLQLVRLCLFYAEQGQAARQRQGETSSPPHAKMRTLTTAPA